MRLRFVLAAGAGLGAITASALAQGGSAEPPVVAVPPPTRTEVPPAPAAPAVPGQVPPAPAELVEPPSETVVIPPPPPPPPPEPVTIDPDAAYPEGFADPADPFANDMSLEDREQGGGFDWGLLGLLGLLGLIPLFRRRGGDVRTVHIEHEDGTSPPADRGS